MLHQYSVGKPYVQGEYHYFARGIGDIGWVARDGNGAVTWGNEKGSCVDQASCPGGWSSEIIWNKISEPQAADMAYKCW